MEQKTQLDASTFNVPNVYHKHYHSHYLVVFLVRRDSSSQEALLQGPARRKGRRCTEGFHISCITLTDAFHDKLDATHIQLGGTMRIYEDPWEPMRFTQPVYMDYSYYGQRKWRKWISRNVEVWSMETYKIFPKDKTICFYIHLTFQWINDYIIRSQCINDYSIRSRWINNCIIRS